MPGRPLADQLELRFPGVLRRVGSLAMRAPSPIRRRIVAQAMARAEAAFNRGDFEVIFATFAADAEYVPPPPLGGPELVRGRAAALDFWRQAIARWPESSIENLEVVSLAPDLIVRRARLRHRRPDGDRLDYEIRQSTHLRRGAVVRQVNEIAA